MTDLLARARAYVDKMPLAVAGQQGHDATFKVAKALVHGFALSETDAMPILREYSSRCLPPWSEKELEHKLKSASEWDKYDKPRGYLIGGGRSSTPIKAADPPPRAKKKISPPWLDPKTRQPKQAAQEAIKGEIDQSAIDQGSSHLRRRVSPLRRRPQWLTIS